MTKPIRAALYIRVSTTDHGQDVGLQLDELRQVAAQRSWGDGAYIDEGVWGSKDRLPGLDTSWPTPAPATSSLWPLGASTVSPPTLPNSSPPWTSFAPSASTSSASASRSTPPP
jgi:hypothetical protein